MGKFNVTMLIKIAGMALTIGGTILSGIGKDRSDKQILENLVKERFEN